MLKAYGLTAATIGQQPVLQLESISTANPFLTKHIELFESVKVGRQVSPKQAPNAENGIFDSKALSRQHAEIYLQGGKVFVKDVGSSNGTFLNGQRLSEESQPSEPEELHTGDRIDFGVDIVNDDNAMFHQVSCKVTLIESNAPVAESSSKTVEPVTSVPSIEKTSTEATVTSILQQEYDRAVAKNKELERINASLKEITAPTTNDAQDSDKIKDLPQRLAEAEKRSAEAEGARFAHIQELSDAQKQIVQLSQSADERVQNDASAQVTALQQSNQSLQKSLNEALLAVKESKSRHEQLLDKSKTDLLRADERFQSVTVEGELLKEQVKLKEAQLVVADGLSKQVQDIGYQRDAVIATLNAHKHNEDKLKAEIKQLTENLSTVQIALSAAEENAGKLSEEVFTLSSQLKEQQAEASARQDLISKLKAENETIKSELGAVSTARKLSETKIAELIKQHSQALEKESAARKEADTKVTELRTSISSENGKISGALKEAEVRLRDLNSAHEGEFQKEMSARELVEKKAREQAASLKSDLDMQVAMRQNAEKKLQEMSTHKIQLEEEHAQELKEFRESQNAKLSNSSTNTTVAAKTQQISLVQVFVVAAISIVVTYFLTGTK